MNVTALSVGTTNYFRSIIFKEEYVYQVSFNFVNTFSRIRDHSMTNGNTYVIISSGSLRYFTT